MNRMASTELKVLLQTIIDGNLNTKEKLEAAGIRHEFLGSGLDKSVYTLLDTPWVIKMGRVEYAKQGDSNWQISNEAKCIVALRNIPIARKFMPGLIYASPDGSFLIMLRYTTFKWESDEQADSLNEEIQTIKKEFEKAVPGWCFSDVGNSNIGKDAAGRFKVIDLGCFGYEGSNI